MAKPISKFTDSLKQLGEIQVNDWDFMSLLNKDLKDVEISKSLRRLGSIRVMEWDFKTVLPAVNKLAHQEVDIVDLVKRTAAYKVMEWDFRKALHSDHPLTSKDLEPSAKPDAAAEGEIQAVILQLKGFLEFVVLGLVDEPRHATIKVKEIAPRVLRFKVVLVKRDVAMLVGTGGHTASAIRNLLKTSAGRHGMQALLVVLSHEEEISAKTD
jgi:predicted RNA-binding protein YlqC (UPF0109 family)